MPGINIRPEGRCLSESASLNPEILLHKKITNGFNSPGNLRQPHADVPGISENKILPKCS